MDNQNRKKSGVYLMRFAGSDTVYIGSTAVSFQRRQWAHKGMLRKRTHRNKHLQHAFDLYGVEALEFMILEVVDDPGRIVPREQYWLDWFSSIGSVYNILQEAGTTRGHRGRSVSEEEKKELSDALTGRKLPPEHIENIKAAWTPEKRQALSEQKRGKKLNLSPEQRAAYSRKGIPQNRRPYKTYEGFIAPDGAEHRDILGLRAFAAAHGLEHRTLVEVDSGRVLSHKGWRRIAPVRASQRTRVFNLIGPDGTHYIGITNLDAFCREHGLQAANMGEMYSGKKKKYLGWKRLEII